MGNDRLLDLWTARPRSWGIGVRPGKIASGKSLVLPAPARLLPLLPTGDLMSVVRHCLCCVLHFVRRHNGQRPGAFAPSPGWPPVGTGDATCRLLQLGGGASGLEVLLQLLGLFLRDAFLHFLRRAL